jgi:outer membrane protein insertion porin family
MRKRRSVWQLAGCIMVCLLGVQAADLTDPSEFAGKRVTSLRFEPANQPLTQAQLTRAFPVQPGAVLTTVGVRSAIKSLYATGRYTDVEVAAEPVGTGGMGLVVHTKDRWFVGPVEVKGKASRPPNSGQLVNATQLQLGQPFNEEDLQGAVQGMQGLLQRNGLYSATIEPQVARDAAHQQVSVTFLLKTGKRARLTLPNITGNTVLPPQKVASAAKYKGWFHWKPATNENVQSGVKNIHHKYQKQNRLTSTVRVTRRDYDAATNRVKPTIEANGGPKVTIHATGGKVSKGKLHEYVPVFDEGTVNRDLLVQGATSLHDYFQSIGYFDAQVDFRSRDISPDEQEITYLLTLGPRHKVVKVTIQGNHYFRTQDIRDRMFLHPAGFITLRHGRYSESFVSRDEESIKSLYQANGFRDVKVTAASVDDYKGKTGNVAVTVTIVEGPQYSVSGLTLNGVSQLNKESISQNLALTPGQPFSETNVGMDRDFILRTYQTAGFPDATFTYKATPGPVPNQVQIEYNVTEGKRQYVRDVLITGLTHTRLRLVDPIMKLHAGDPISLTQMGTIQRGLYQLGVFDTVDMAVQDPDGDTDQKYVVYHLVEGHRYSVALGAGAEIAQIGGSEYSLYNPQGQTGFSPRGSFEISRLDMFGLGQSLNFKSRVSSLDDLASLTYVIPEHHDQEGPQNFSITALYDNERDVRTFAERRLEADFQYSQKLSKPTTILWRYSYRDTRISALKINPELIPIYSAPALIGELSANLVQDHRDNPADAHRGFYNTIDVGLAAHFFGSRTNFGKILLRNSYYHPIGHMVIASNTEFGVLAPFTVPRGETGGEYIPFPERFFGGGNNSERGFPDDQAGPRDDDTGFPIGGSALLFHSTELRFPLIGSDIGGVLFHDMGNIYSSVGAISFRVHQDGVTDFDYMNHAVGFGIRYKTPLGPIRVDLAYSLNPPAFYGLQGTYEQLLFGGQGCPGPNCIPPPVRVLQSVSHFQFFFSIGQAF